MLSLKEELEKRGLLYQVSSEDLFEKFDKWEWSFYCWFDPTADSLHLGNFIGFMVAIHLMRRWNKYIALTGWATGMIWDPGGKDAERNFLSKEDLENNKKAISTQIKKITDNLKEFTWEKFKCDFVDNKDFYVDMWYLDFLREVWKYITVNNMIAKDTVRKRIEDPKQSISYTEFSYMLLQGYDFVKLYKDDGVTLQIGWQDQWWNLVTGTELIRKKYDWDANVFTWPLITDASWKKFGKSEWNAIWLDKNKTSPYEIYQYFMNTADNDIERYLKMLTLIELPEIEKIVKEHMEKPEERKGQKVLAFKVVEIIHWVKDAQVAEKISALLFGKDDKVEIIKNADEEEIASFYKELGWCEYGDESLFDMVVKAGLAKSNWEVRNAVKSGAIYINEQKVVDFKYDFSDDFINGKVLLVRKGKKNFWLVLKK